METGTTTQSQQALTRKEVKDLKVLALFTSVYCHAHHDGEKACFDAEALDLPGLGVRRRTFCTECRDFLAYAVTRRIQCPLDPKPTCKHCHIHCYGAGHREKVKDIMRFSGQRLIRRGRLDLLWHYLF